MRWVERQERLQERVEDYIDELAEEFKLPVPYYPEVLWVSKYRQFKELGLSKKYKSTFDYLRETNGLHRDGYVFITEESGDAGIAEEAIHSLHNLCSNTNLYRLSKDDLQYYSIISEMLAYFGCLELGIKRNDREELFGEWPDSFTNVEVFKDFVSFNEDVIQASPSDFISSVIHHQGYTLGERLFYSYIAGETSPKEIKKLFTKNHNKPNSTQNTFYDLREKLWSITNPEWIYEEDENGEEEEPDFMVVW